MGPAILIADDTADIRFLVGHLLDSDGDDWDISFAEDGADAVDVFRSRSFDFVLLDYMMPRLNGLAAARVIRDQAYTGPIVVWSSAGLAIPREEAEALGASVLDKNQIGKLRSVLRTAAAGWRETNLRATREREA